VLGGKLVRKEVGVAGFAEPAGEELEVIVIAALGSIGKTFFNFTIIEERLDKIHQGLRPA
jgi:hypothetical protein